jgi:hypothetical protein
MNQAHTVIGIRGHGEIESVEGGADAKHGDRCEPEREACLRSEKKGSDHSDYGQRGEPESEAREFGKRHFACAELRRKEIGAEAGLWSARQNDENHERSVDERQRGVGVG